MDTRAESGMHIQLQHSNKDLVISFSYLFQIGAQSQYHTLTDSTCTTLEDLNYEGTQCHLDKIFPSVTEIRYTDDKQTTFLHAVLKGEDYWNAIHK